MKNGKLILTKDDMVLIDYNTLKRLYGNDKEAQASIELIDILKEQSTETKAIQSYMNSSTLTMICSRPDDLPALILQINVKNNQPIQLAESALLMIATAATADLFYKSLRVVLEDKFKTLTYDYRIEYSKEHNRYEVADVNDEGILK